MSDQALVSAVTSSATACQPVCVEPQLSFADQTAEESTWLSSMEEHGKQPPRNHLPSTPCLLGNQRGTITTAYQPS